MTISDQNNSAENDPAENEQANKKTRSLREALDKDLTASRNGWLVLLFFFLFGWWATSKLF